jgi:xanthine dehydrogenase YagS FAD-binding subunit
MKTFDYMVAENLDAALAEYSDAKKPTLKAGGIDLIDLMKERIVTPDAVLSIGKAKDLAYIKEDGGGVRIGCLTTLADIGRSRLLAEKYAALHSAAGHAATPQVRERATIGGNLCQRPRCWYFRNAEFHCLKKGGSTCFAVEGENEYHAILGGGPCHIVHPSNTAPALIALDARVVVANKEKRREIPAAEFFVLPSQNLAKENVLAEGEIVVEIVIPKAPQQSAAIEFREKQSFDWPIAMAAVARIDGRWRAVLGAVAPTPWMAKQAMEILGNNDVTEDLATKAAEAALADAKPLSHNAYKVQVAKVALKRALLKASGKEIPA